MMASRTKISYFVFVLIAALTLCQSGLAVRVEQISKLDAAHSSFHAAMSPDGKYVVVGSDGSDTVSLFTSDGDFQWDYTMAATVQMESGAVANNAGIVVIGGQNNAVYCLTNSGTLKWKRTDIFGEIPVAVTSSGDKVYATSLTDDLLYCLNGVNGKTVWSAPFDTRESYWAVWEVSVTPTGNRILLRTNSDIIICNSLGNETHFFDVAPGNSLVGADLSEDGNSFAVTFNDGGDYYVALYNIPGGEVWREPIADYGGVCMDGHGNVLVSVNNDKNYMYDHSGTLIAMWDDEGWYSIDCATDTDLCVVGNPDAAKVFEIKNLTHYCYPGLEDPMVYVESIEPFESGGTLYNRYNVTVPNRMIYPEALFDPSPDLPPCGANNNSSRSWITKRGSDGSYLGGYCMLGGPEDLELMSFVIAADGSEPNGFYIEIEDRRCGITYTSAVAPLCVCYPYLPDPILAIVDWEYIEVGGQKFTNYSLNVLNKYQYPDELFEPAPDLPPCGTQTDSPRTWIYLYDKYVGPFYGYCNIDSADELDTMVAAIAWGEHVPELVYIALNDRKCGITYESNAVSTSWICPTADLNNDCQVDWRDLAILAGQWLEGVAP